MPGANVGVPSLSSDLATVEVYALSAGHLTLPEKQFVSPALETERKTVPSLSFLVRHESPGFRRKLNILFDLGLRRDTSRYSEPIQRHLETRQPLSTDPDVVKSLALGGLSPEDIDYVIYSHVHWDHWGMPQDFEHSTFIVGPGSLKLLKGENPGLRGGHSHFEKDLPETRVVELRAPGPKQGAPRRDSAKQEVSSTTPDFLQEWRSLDELPEVIDVFHDGSLCIVNAPGHLPGHINLLVRTSASKSVYLAGDTCHDRRLLTKEKDIAEWQDDNGKVCCIHANREEAEQTLARIAKLEQRGIKVILAHDVEWEQDSANRTRFWGVTDDIPSTS